MTFFSRTVCPWFSLTMTVKDPLFCVVLLTLVELVVPDLAGALDVFDGSVDAEVFVLLVLLVGW